MKWVKYCHGAFSIALIPGMPSMDTEQHCIKLNIPCTGKKKIIPLQSYFIDHFTLRWVSIGFFIP